MEGLRPGSVSQSAGEGIGFTCVLYSPALCVDMKAGWSGIMLSLIFTSFKHVLLTSQTSLQVTGNVIVVYAFCVLCWIVM